MSENQELNREKNLGYYCQRFTELKTSQKLGPKAEYKPILILSVIDLITQGLINRIDNGISFCKNHHWAFDKGLFTIANDYKIIVSKNFQEESPNSKPMKEFNGNQLWLPNQKESFPRIEALQWHRQNVFIS